MLTLMENEKYYRHLTPILIEGWDRCIASDFVGLCKDSDIPEDFRSELKSELFEIKEEIDRAIIETEKEEW